MLRIAWAVAALSTVLLAAEGGQTWRDPSPVVRQIAIRVSRRVMAGNFKDI